MINETEILRSLLKDVSLLKVKYERINKAIIENSFKNEEYLKIYSLYRQLKVLKQTTVKIMQTSQSTVTLAKIDFIFDEIQELFNKISYYDFDDLEICPNAEDLKYKYNKMLQPETEENTIIK